MHNYDTYGLEILTAREKILMQIALNYGYERGHDDVLDGNFYDIEKGLEISAAWIEGSIEDDHISEEIDRIVEYNLGADPRERWMGEGRKVFIGRVERLVRNVFSRRLE